MRELLFKDEVYAVVGAAMETYNELGNGFLEAVYQEAFEMELREREIPFCSQKILPLYDKGCKLKKEYKADLIAYDKIVIELKSEEHLTKNDESQLLKYLNATNFQLGILVNCGAENSLEWKRMILTSKRVTPPAPRILNID